MAEITLADYTGYIFLEIIKAREMADMYSRLVAERYAQDPVLKHFSAPRFKVPKMELTIPVLISGARFHQLIRFKMGVEEFVAFIQGRVKDMVSSVEISEGTILLPPRPPVLDRQAQRRLKRRVAHDSAARSPARSRQVIIALEDPRKNGPPPIDELARKFHRALVENPDPMQPGNIVTVMWARIFNASLAHYGLVEIYERYNPNNELFKKTAADVVRTVTANTVVERTTIENLLVNPETNVVKNGSNESSVFTIKAEMLEEGFFIREIRDEDTGDVRPIVEFE